MSIVKLCTQIYSPGPESFEAESLYTQVESSWFSLHALVPNLNPSSWEAGNPVLSRVISECGSMEGKLFCLVGIFF